MRDVEQGRGGFRWRGGNRANASRRNFVRRATFEPLEDRRLLAVTTPIISEFLASNNSSIQDEDGNHSDWIELYNPTPSDLNLGGYYLTDDATTLTKWQLPSVTVPSGGYQIVWASGKNRAVAGSPLHTNFSLDASAGEYLALVAPDGVTPVSQYTPTFPPQASDVSYGVTTSSTATSIIGPNNTARAHVPTAGENLGLTWTSPTFNDASWTAGTTGAGYETDSPPPSNPGFRVRMVDVSNGTSSAINTTTDAAAILDSADGTANGRYVVQSDTTVVKSVINMGPGGAYGGDQALPNGQTNADLYVLRSTAVVTIPAGTWTINCNSDDGFRLKIPGVTFSPPTGGASLLGADTFEFAGLRGAANSFSRFTVPAGGLTTTLQLDFFENQGGDSVELSVASGSPATFSTGQFQLLGDGLLGWSVKDPVTVGPPNYRSLIGTDLQSQMFNVNATAYVRIPFSVANAGDYQSLRLQMKYDDGFVAYLNGVEVARRNAPAALAYNSAATGEHPDVQALQFESIAIPSTALHTGNNVLAIQALNLSPGDSDLLVYPQLQNFTSQVGTTANFYAKPTPAADNTGPTSLGVVADTKFSVDRGFFDAPFQVAITTATDGAEIHYTTDGSTPSATNGTVYTGPLTIDHTTTLRAAAFKSGFVPTNSDTQTYIFPADVILQSPNAEKPGPTWPAAGQVNGQTIDYGMDPNIVNNPTWGPQLISALKAIPTFSIVTDTKNLFDPSTGIYVNPGQDGIAWERPASVELIYPDGTKGFQIDAGLRIRGGYSRSGGNPKHAFRLFFRTEYGGKLKYPMFGPDGAQSFDGFDLRTTENYSWAFEGNPISIFMRDQFSRDTQLAMGEPAERGNWYHLYIDGEYWGLYNTDERAEASYAASYFGGDKEDYDVIKVNPDDGYILSATDGNFDAWNQLYQILKGPVTDDVYQLVQGNNSDGTANPAKPVLLDVDNLIDYMMVIYYGGNLDASISNFLSNQSPNNFFSIRNRNLDARMGFKFFAHDSEHTLLDVNQNRLGPSPGVGWPAGDQDVSKSSPQWFFQRLWASPEFKLRVADHIQKYMVNPDGLLTPTAVKNRLTPRRDELEPAIVAESARWGDSKREPPLTKNDYDNAWNSVLNSYVPARTNIVIGQFKQWGLFPAFNGPNFTPPGGQLSQGAQVTITPGTGTPAGASIYYTLDGSDPRLRGGAVSPTAILYTGPITVNDTTHVKARTLSGTTWSAIHDAIYTIDLAAVRITELMYNPAPPAVGSPYTADDFEYVELTNTGPSDRDLTGLRIAGGIDYTFPNLYKLAAGARVVVVKNLAAFQSRYGNAVNVAPGTFTGSLSDGGELLKLQSATGQVSLSFTYNDSWYPQTDGEGFSLNVLDPAGPVANWNLKAGWGPSNRNGGTPGAPNDGLPVGEVIINEVLTTPEAGSATGDFIELYNTTANPIDVSGWYLSDSSDNLKKFQIPAGTTIAANGYLVFQQSQLGFDIGSAAGDVYLRNGDGSGAVLGYRDSRHFGAGDPGFSYGQFAKSTGGTDFVMLQAPTPGAPNGPARVGPVVINELMYQPRSGQLEYVELRNLGGSDVVLNNPADPTSAWKFVDGIDYTFPAGATIPAFGYALVVPGDAATFRSVYSVPPGVPIFGGYQHADGSNNLSNTGEEVTLYRPSPNGDILADRVNYTTAFPWPAGATGTGASIGRSSDTGFGNDPASWDVEQDGGSPGRANFDFDRPTVQIIPVTPDPRTTPVDSVTIVFDEPVQGFDLSDLVLSRDGGTNLLTGSETLVSNDDMTWTVSGLSGLTGAAGTYTLRLSAASSGVSDWASNTLSADATETWRVRSSAGRVVGRKLFYNNSSFDGAGAGANAADDGAIATDKQALLPGQAAGFANYTSYYRGINGVMVDVSGLGGNLSASDFLFSVGNDANPAGWSAAPAPLSVSRRAGAGTNGSDRVTILWADGAIKNQWLRVTVLPNANTDLPAADVFYFGNWVGETGDSVTSAGVTAADVLAVRSGLMLTGVPVSNALDFNRDGRVNTADLAVVRGAVSGASLTLFAAPAAPAPAAAVAGSKSSPFGNTAIPPTSTGSRSQPQRRGILTESTDLLGRT